MSFILFEGVTFAYPYLLMLPLLYLLLLLRSKQRVSCPAYADGNALEYLPMSLRQYIRKPLLLTLTALAITSLTVAAARPQRLQAIIENKDRRNIMLALDISRSMTTVDFRSGFQVIPRVDAVKSVVAQFVEARKGDRVGLAVFGSRAYLQSPLTPDTNLVHQMVRTLQVGVAGDGTAIGDGLGVALKAIQDLRRESRAVVLLTDGVNNSGRVDPIKAAQVAKDLGVKIHTVGIGGIGGAAANLALPGFPFRAAQKSHFDEATLKRIAETTGGVYFHAHDIEGLQQVYDEINILESTEAQEPELRQYDELFVTPLLLGIGLFLFVCVLERTVFRVLPG